MEGLCDAFSRFPVIEVQEIYKRIHRGGDRYSLAEYFLIRPTSNVLIISGIILGAGAYYLSFHKKNGMNMEYFLVKKVRQYILANSARKYRTKNGYVRIMNEAYKRERMKDLNDPQKRRKLKKRERRGRWKKTRMEGYK